jgi:hypothetical protein
MTTYSWAYNTPAVERKTGITTSKGYMQWGHEMRGKTR